jgi:hypothetical protein
MPAPDLDRLQRWFATEVAEPSRGSTGRRAARARVLPSATLRPEERLAIYARMYVSRLHDCLAEDYAAVTAVLGEPRFGRLVRAYARRHPSRHYSLTALGRSMPAFLRTAAVPRRALLTDLARLELAMTEVFHAAQAEPLDAAALASVPPALWPRSKLRPIPAFAVLALEHDANAIVTAVRQGRPLPPLRRRKSWVAVWRRDHVVWRQDLDASRFALLDALARGRPVGRALASAAAHWTGDPAELPGRVTQWFAGWTASGLFASVELPATRGTPRSARARRARRAGAARQPAASRS